MGDDLDRFRERARAFLGVHTTAAAVASTDDPRGDLALDRALGFQRALHAAGLAGLSVSPVFGGHGLPAAYETAWREEAGRFPLMTEQLSITLGNCLPTLLEFGTDAQRHRHVPRILAGREVWCQLFSEPGAGSDIAGVQTRAVPVSGGWLVNGQKVWTTLAHRADFGILLARTDPAAAKHDGLSMLIVDLRAAGVEVRPIRQLDGAMHFDEVFLTDVFVSSDSVLPPAGRVGASRRGCSTTSASLAPRVSAAGCATTARTDSSTRPGDASSPIPWCVTRLVRLYIAEVCQSLLVSRSLAATTTAKGADPGPVGSLGKLTNALVARQFADLAWRIVGADALAWYGPATRPTRADRTGSTMGGRRAVHAVAVHRRRHERDPAFDHRRTRAGLPANPPSGSRPAPPRSPVDHNGHRTPTPGGATSTTVGSESSSCRWATDMTRESVRPQSV